MRPAGALLTVVGFVLALMVAQPALAPAKRNGGDERPQVRTDGRLRPGHLETIWVKGFDGRGLIEVAFFPSAICEDECAGRGSRAGYTHLDGSGRFRVHVPGTFIDQHHRSTYFRDRERINVLVTWEAGPRRFAVAEAEPEPILVRSHPSRND